MQTPFLAPQFSAAQFKTTLERLEIHRIRSDLLYFIRKAFQELNPFAQYVHNWYIEFYAEIALAVFNRELKRYIINVPPGCMKSMFFSAIQAAWILGHRPYERFIGVSNSESLTNRNSRWTKKIMASKWYKEAFPEVQLSKETESFFETTQGGFRQSFTTFGSITGERGNYLQLDDYMSVHIVRSDTERKNALWLFDEAFENRLNNEAEDVIGVIEQRLHTKDLTGHLMSRGGRSFTNFILPAEFEKKEHFYIRNFSKTVEIGDLLDPVRLSKAVLEDKKNKVVDEETGVANGSQMYSAQYLQKPVADGGNMVKMAWFKRYKPEILEFMEFDTIVVSVDSAQKPEELHDPWAFTKWGIKDNHCYLLATSNIRSDYPEGKQRLRSFCDASPTPHFVLIEDHSTGSSLIQEFKLEGLYSVIAMKTKGIKKEIRFSNCTGQIASGNVFLPDRASWLFEYEDQLMKFPFGENDDLCDSTSQFLNWSKNRSADLEFWAVTL